MQNPIENENKKINKKVQFLINNSIILRDILHIFTPLIYTINTYFLKKYLKDKQNYKIFLSFFSFTLKSLYLT